jgi:hypothetical protein
MIEDYSRRCGFHRLWQDDTMRKMTDPNKPIIPYSGPATPHQLRSHSKTVFASVSFIFIFIAGMCALGARQRMALL